MITFPVLALIGVVAVLLSFILPAVTSASGTLITVLRVGGAILALVFGLLWLVPLL